MPLRNRRSSRVCSASVLAVADRRDEPGLPGAAELLVQLPARLPAADRRPVQFPEPELIDLAGADVRRFADEPPASARAARRRCTTRMYPRSNLSASVKTVIGLGTGMRPLPRSGSGISGMPSAVRLTNWNEFGASSSRFRTAGWLVRSGRASEYGSLVMPNPARSTIFSRGRERRSRRAARTSSC